MASPSSRSQCRRAGGSRNELAGWEGRHGREAAASEGARAPFGRLIGRLAIQSSSPSAAHSCDDGEESRDQPDCPRHHERAEGDAPGARRHAWRAPAVGIAARRVNPSDGKTPIFPAAAWAAR